MVTEMFDAVRARMVRLPRRRHARAPFGRYALAGGALALVGIANGALREVGYRRFIGEQRAHQVSSLTFAALFAGYTWLVEERWPLRSRHDALTVGAMWITTGAGFDFVVGHYIDHKPWSTLLRDYNVAAGRLWGLDVAWLGVAPEAVRTLKARKLRVGRRASGGA